MVKSKNEFFQVGGTLSEDSASYIERPADDDLVGAIERGELCLVLASRQTGKSSLMVHARARLKKLGIAVGIVDFQPLGSHREEDPWFRDTVYQIQRSLQLQMDTLAWWDAHQRLGPTQRFMTFIEDVVLVEIEGRVVIFFDEIDSVLPLSFSDDFFTTIRALYNARASNPTLKRITFVLLGVATPSELIKSRSRTPFNVGMAIELKDFDPGALGPFKEVLGESSETLVGRIFYWTSGHPLMVQKLAAAAYSWPDDERTGERLDDAVQAVYLDAKIEKDTHLKFIRDYLVEDNKQLRKTLRTYRTVLQEQEVPYNDQSPIHSRLKLAGVVRTDAQRLVSRNRIYRGVFDLGWIKANTPRDVTKMVAYGASAALVGVLLWFFLVQPLFFPKFTQMWGRELYYTEETVFQLDVPSPLRGVMAIGPGYDISSFVRVALDDQELAWPMPANELQGRGLTVRLEKLPLGASEHLLRFYGGIWEENFEIPFSVVSYPMTYWKPMPDPEMVTVRAGCFEMGCGEWDGECDHDELPVHHVCLDGFEIGKYEVTQSQWEQIMGYNPSFFKKGGSYPVETVSWHDVQEFIRRLNTMSGQRFRLPTEAEWEYAARSGGKPEKYSGGADMDAVAWYRENSEETSHPVGQKTPNGLGVHDMSGNVWEWCQDWYSADYYRASPERNPKGPEDGPYRVIRGGGWFRDVRYCRSAIRFGNSPGIRGYALGFRLSRDVALGP